MLKPEMKQSSKREQSEGTRNALIMTGARLFASKGYHAVSVRELTSEAGVNLATVSYHFGGKAGLYEAIFRYIITRHDEITPSAEEVRKKWAASPDTPQGKCEVVDWYVSTLVHGLIGPQDHIWACILLTHEITQPSELFPLLEKEFFMPAQDGLLAFVDGALPPGTDKEERIITAQIVINMCLKFLESEQLISKWIGWDEYGEYGINKIATVIGKRIRGMLGLPME